MKWLRASAVVGCLLVSSLPAFAQANIDTRPAWNGSNSISEFGFPDTTTYGQTITTTDMSVVTGFEFEVSCNAPTTVRGHIYHWDPVNLRATGASAFDSAPTVVPGDSLFHAVSTNAGVVVLPAGTYVVFLSVSQDPQPASTCVFGAVADTAYAPGQFVYFNDSGDPSLWTTTSWDGALDPIAEDAAFLVTFAGNAVPTMPEWMLLITIAMTTLAAATLIRRRRLVGRPSH